MGKEELGQEQLERWADVTENKEKAKEARNKAVGILKRVRQKDYIKDRKGPAKGVVKNARVAQNEAEAAKDAAEESQKAAKGVKKIAETTKDPDDQDFSDDIQDLADVTEMDARDAEDSAYEAQEASEEAKALAELTPEEIAEAEKKADDED